MTLNGQIREKKGAAALTAKMRAMMLWTVSIGGKGRFRGHEAKTPWGSWLASDAAHQFFAFNWLDSTLIVAPSRSSTQLV